MALKKKKIAGGPAKWKIGHLPEEKKSCWRVHCKKNFCWHAKKKEVLLEIKGDLGIRPVLPVGKYRTKNRRWPLEMKKERSKLFKK